MRKQSNSCTEPWNYTQFGTEIEGLIRQCDYFSAKYSQIKRESERKSSRIEALFSAMERYEVENQKAYASIENLQAQNETYSRLIQEQSNNYEQLKLENNSLIEETRQMRSFIWDIIDQCDCIINSEHEEYVKVQMDLHDEMSVMADHIWELIAYQGQLEKQIDLMEKSIGKQKIQISYLQSQNDRYQRSIRRVTDTWYGRMLLKLYRWFMKIGIIK
jgi:hypothetical protein